MKMENNEVKGLKLIVQRETFMEGLEKANAFLSKGVIQGGNMISLNISAKKGVMGISAMSGESSLFQTVLSLDEVNQDMTIYIDGPTTYNKLVNLRQDTLTLEFKMEEMKLIITGGKSKSIINAYSEYNFDGDKIVNNKGCFVIPNTPIRVVSRIPYTNQNVPSLSIEHERFENAIKSMYLNPYPKKGAAKKDSGYVKLKVMPKESKMECSAFDGVGFTVCDLKNVEIENLEDTLMLMIPVEMLKKIEKVFYSKGSEKTAIKMYINEKLLLLMKGKSMIRIPRENIEMADFGGEVFDRAAMVEMVVNADELISSVKFAQQGSLSVGEKQSQLDDAFTIDLEEKKLIFSTKSLKGESSESEVDYISYGKNTDRSKIEVVKAPYQRLINSINQVAGKNSNLAIRIINLNDVMCFIGFADANSGVDLIKQGLAYKMK